ncbi:MAG: ATP-binding protein [Candidatus Auribacterota bacterium]|nr:ATP-binding protein [Candidatus Auribacterota bacterium]
MPGRTKLSFALKKQNIRHILILEKYIMVPLKLLVIAVSFYFLRTLDPSFEREYYFFQLKLYVIANLFFVMALLLSSRKKFHPGLVRWAAFFLSLIDNVYVSFLIFFTGGVESELYMMYPGLFLRNAINFPKIKFQQTINISCILCYIGAIYSQEKEFTFLFSEIFLLRFSMLLLFSFCCWGIYFLLQQKILKMQEERERTIRSEKLNIASKLTSQAAHELKNPLAIINNALYLIQKNIETHPEKIMQNVDIIQQQVDRSNKIISELLDYTRFSEGKIGRINVNDVIEEWLLQHFDGSDEILSSIQCVFDESIPDLLIDKHQFSLILSHIIQNAIDAERDNEKMKIIIRTLFNDDEELELHIHDNGIGVQEDLKDLLFTPFFTTKQSHVGLGLSIAKNIAETYGGSIYIESQADAGSHVWVVLPVHTHTTVKEDSMALC